MQVVVAVNRRSSDTNAEIACVIEAALKAGAAGAAEASHWAHGGVVYMDPIFNFKTINETWCRLWGRCIGPSGC